MMNMLQTLQIAGLLVAVSLAALLVSFLLNTSRVRLVRLRQQRQQTRAESPAMKAARPPVASDDSVTGIYRPPKDTTS
jgi:hypothetical protein